MHQTKDEIFMHLVWSTWRREPYVTDAIERSIHRCIQAKARALGCKVLAVDGMPDHVHLVTKVPTTVCAAEIAKRTKGASSTLGRNIRDGEPFGWQDGYSVRSVSPNGVAAVVE